MLAVCNGEISIHGRTKLFVKHHLTWWCFWCIYFDKYCQTGWFFRSLKGMFSPWWIKFAVIRPCLSMPPLGPAHWWCPCVSMRPGWQWVARLPGDQWMRQSRRMGIEPSELCILTALAKLAWGVFWSTSIDPPVFNMFFGRFWGPVEVPVRNHIGKLLLLNFEAVLFRKGCVLVDFFPTCWALGLRCWSWIFGRPPMVWGQDTWRYEVRQRRSSR